MKKRNYTITVSKFISDLDLINFWSKNKNCKLRSLSEQFWSQLLVKYDVLFRNMSSVRLLTLLRTSLYSLYEIISYWSESFDFDRGARNGGFFIIIIWDKNLNTIISRFQSFLDRTLLKFRKKVPLYETNNNCGLLN
jgi:hypothetical protein